MMMMVVAVAVMIIQILGYAYMLPSSHMVS